LVWDIILGNIKFTSRINVYFFVSLYHNKNQKIMITKDLANLQNILEMMGYIVEPYNSNYNLTVMKHRDFQTNEELQRIVWKGKEVSLIGRSLKSIGFLFATSYDYLVPIISRAMRICSEHELHEFSVDFENYILSMDKSYIYDDLIVFTEFCNKNNISLND